MNSVENKTENEWLFQTIKDAISYKATATQKTERNFNIFIEYFVLNKTFKEIGVKYGISSTCVRLIAYKCLRKVRGYMSKKCSTEDSLIMREKLFNV